MPDFGAATDVNDWGQRLAERLAPLVDGAAMILAPWAGDGHPDHDACGQVAATVAVTAAIPLVSFPVWSWNWDRPDAPAIPFQRAFRFDFDEGLLVRKRAGIAAYVSQIHAEDGNRPVLPADFLTHFTRPAEVFLLPG